MANREITLLDELHSMCASEVLLRRQIEEKRASALRELHRQVKLPDMEALIRALWAIAPAELRAELGESKSSEETARRRHAKGVRYDGAFRARVRAALEERRLKPAAVRGEFGVSIATLAKWMKEWGITPQRRSATNGASSPPPSLESVNL